MADRLANLEEAEELVIGLLETAGQTVGELKEIQANNAEKNNALLSLTNDYYTKLATIKRILTDELNALENVQPASTHRPGIDKLAIAEWEAKVIADNLHELVNHS
ncbi:hypothetical protein TRFO_21565 [Tritrichomonas foetus]|uniref:Mediator of RNA polymerase II transcription subunit 11 n=1 Tax=Tritrichomonas foetus TaxID=1144522 RepID=A0A1J4KIJ3_9EUKA|nr:hypothetical protein TRFO_21565 [Tritrichomonas foetus]|eukprot:OHT09518.1 hypothetical protein TRFO_21565 [Tritrichomonas foetus]